jgi:hypothetical protein
MEARPNERVEFQSQLVECPALSARQGCDHGFMWAFVADAIDDRPFGVRSAQFP